MIEVRNLDVWYGRGSAEAHVVRGASLHVERGRSFGLVGESGSGKSTILRAIAGLAPRWTGDIAVAGIDARDGHRGRRRRDFQRTVQMVFQDPFASLHPKRLVGDAVSEPMRIARMTGIDERTDLLFADIGLTPAHRYRYPHELSGGQRQRIAIARALALEPEVMLLDEPTSALDLSIQAEILNLLERLRAERGLTYLIVSHDLAVIGHMCGRLAVMAQGRIVETLDRDALARGDAATEYTRELIAASGHEVSGHRASGNGAGGHGARA